ncbi:MAG: hypothetical protein AB1442_01160 [Nitrospirota bacterium]
MNVSNSASKDKSTQKAIPAVMNMVLDNGKDEVLKRLPAWYVELKNAYLRQSEQEQKSNQNVKSIPKAFH